MYPSPVGAGRLHVVVKHLVANVDVDVQEEHNLRDFHLHLRAMAQDLLTFVLQFASTAIQRTQVPKDKTS